LAEGFEERFRANYADILRLARARLARERSPISTGTLAHELYLNLQGRQDLSFATPGEFMAYASRAKRAGLGVFGRERRGQKRHPELKPLAHGADVPDQGGTPEQLVALDDALTRLGSVDDRLMRVAEMRVIMGMEVSEVALALAVSEPTVKRDWQRAKAFLHEALGVPQ
jgi:RNA polymerase sigma factor (TIGR02999 family)